MAEDEEGTRAPALAALIAAVERRHGLGTLQRATSHQPAHACVPSGLAALDVLLDGGFPRGALTALHADPSAGVATLALATLAATLQRDEAAVWLDLPHTFDPRYAAACGVDLDALLVARPEAADTLALLEGLVASAALDLLVIETRTLMRGPSERTSFPLAALPRLVRLLRGTPTAVLLLQPTRLPVAAAAALGLTLQAAEWSSDDTARPMRSVTITVTRRRGGGAGHSVTLDLAFPIGVAL
jgi:hypothetical protein